MSNMFWRFGYTTTQINTILEKPDVTLIEILDEDDVLQECKSNNEKLVTFLTQANNLNDLVSYIITLPSSDIEERSRYKYSTISSELLSCDVSAISDSLMSNKELIDRLYSFLDNEAPLNPLLASYFAKVMGSLITRKTDLLLNYLQTKTDFCEKLLKHINTSAIMDILLRLLTTIDNNELKQRVLTWLNDIDLIKNVITLFSSKYTDDVHSNVSQTLCDIIRISREQVLNNRETQRELNLLNNSNNLNSIDTNNQLPSSDKLFATSSPSVTLNGVVNDPLPLSNQLLDRIEAVETIDQLLDYMFESAANNQMSSLSYGIDVLLTILEPKTATVEFIIETKSLEAERLLKEQERLAIAFRGIKNVSNACVSRLKQFHEILLKKSENPESFTMSFGTLTPPLGTTKLSIIKLISKLVGTYNAKLNEEIVNLGILNTLLNFMFEYKWNNFLHTQVTNIITNVFTYNTPSNTQAAAAASAANVNVNTSTIVYDIQINNLSSDNNNSNTATTTATKKQNLNEFDDDDESNVDDETKKMKKLDQSEDMNINSDENTTPTTAAAAASTNLNSTAIVQNDKEDSNKSTAKTDDIYNSIVLVIEHLFKSCNIIDRLLKAWYEYFDSNAFNPKTGKKSNNAGYIGQLTIICNLITKNTREGNFSTLIKSFFEQINKEICEKWKELEETKLVEINRKNAQDLVRNPLISSSTDSNPESDAIDLPSDENMQRKYVDIVKDLSPSFVEQFGLVENITDLMKKSSGVISKHQTTTFQSSFQMDANEENAQLFDQMCAQRDSMPEALGDAEEDIWVTHEIKYASETQEQQQDSVISSSTTTNLTVTTNLNKKTKNKELRKILNLSDDDNSSSSSSSSDDENIQDDKITKTRNSNVYLAGEQQQPQQQQQNNIEQMDYTNSNDTNFNTFSNNSDNDNWADFSKFNEQNPNNNKNNINNNNNSNDTDQPKISTNAPKQIDDNWANFDNFNELTNERCSSPNDQPQFMQQQQQQLHQQQSNATESDRSKLYAFKEETTTTITTKEIQNENEKEPTETIQTTVIKTLDVQINNNNSNNDNNNEETPMEQSTNTNDESQKTSSSSSSSVLSSSSSFNNTTSSSSSSLTSSLVNSIKLKTKTQLNTNTLTSQTSKLSSLFTTNTNDNEQNELNSNFLFLASKGLMRSSELLNSNNASATNKHNSTTKVDKNDNNKNNNNNSTTNSSNSTNN